MSNINHLTHLERAIELISRLTAELEDEAFQQQGFSDLSMRQLRYLETIARLARPTFSELANELQVSKPSVSVLVQKLVDMKYVQKIQSEEDRRVYHVVLSEKGQRLHEMHHTVHKLLAQRLTRNLTLNEIDQLTVLVQKIIS